MSPFCFTVQWHLLCPHVLPPSSPETRPHRLSTPFPPSLAPGNHCLFLSLWIYLSWIFRIHGIIYVTVRGSSDVARESVLDFAFCFLVGAGWRHSPPGTHIPTRLPRPPSPPHGNLSRKQGTSFFLSSTTTLLAITVVGPLTQDNCLGGDVEYSDWLKPESQSTPCRNGSEVRVPSWSPPEHNQGADLRSPGLAQNQPISQQPLMSPSFTEKLEIHSFSGVTHRQNTPSFRRKGSIDWQFYCLRF